MYEYRWPYCLFDWQMLPVEFTDFVSSTRSVHNLYRVLPKHKTQRPFMSLDMKILLYGLFIVDTMRSFMLLKSLYLIYAKIRPTLKTDTALGASVGNTNMK